MGRQSDNELDLIENDIRKLKDRKMTNTRIFKETVTEPLLHERVVTPPTEVPFQQAYGSMIQRNQRPSPYDNGQRYPQPQGYTPTSSANQNQYYAGNVPP